MLESLIGFLKKEDVEYKENYPMSRISSVRIGGDASLLICPSCIEKFISALDFIKKNAIKHKIIGGMTNILPCDGNYHGALISTRALGGVAPDGDTVVISAGENLGKAAVMLAESGIGGLSELVGIPGTVGGAIAGNAGAFGKDISEVLVDADVYDLHRGCVERMNVSELGFKYRDSIFKHSDHMVILCGRFRIIREDRDKINKQIIEIRHRRASTQPREPSLGSVFKRTAIGSAGRLIDVAGLKGTRIGNAAISERHAGFIVNLGGATAQEYISLAETAAERVYECFGVKPEREVEILV